MADPAKYYRNNLGDSLMLLEALKSEGERRGTTPLPLVFCSTCASYGIPDPAQIPIDESCPQRPINPYGRSKAMVEQLIADFGAAYGLSRFIFRYFITAGADPASDPAKCHTPHSLYSPWCSMPNAMSGGQPCLQIFGDDDSTPDGTCILDSVHLADLAKPMCWGCNESSRMKASIWQWPGCSVKKVIEAAQSFTGMGLLAHVVSRRPGDLPFWLLLRTGLEGSLIGSRVIRI